MNRGVVVVGGGYGGTLVAAALDAEAEVTRGGVGQLPAPGGAAAATPETVYRRKGADLFTARFATRFGRA